MQAGVFADDVARLRVAGKVTQEKIRRKRLTRLHQRIRRAEEKCGTGVRTVRKQRRGGVREAGEGNFLRGQQG